MFTKMFVKAYESVSEQDLDKSTGLFWIVTALAFLFACVLLFGIHCLMGAILMVIYNAVRNFLPQLPILSYWFFVIIAFAIMWIKSTFSNK